jgi:hypothetical protein
MEGAVGGAGYSREWGEQGGTAVRQGAWDNNRWEEQGHWKHCSGSGKQR